jgi:hypothetical protein
MKHGLKKMIKDHIHDIRGSSVRSAVFESHVAEEFVDVREEFIIRKNLSASVWEKQPVVA